MIDRRFTIELTIWTGHPRATWHRPTYARSQTLHSVGAVIAGVEPVLYWGRRKARP